MKNRYYVYFTVFFLLLLSGCEMTNHPGNMNDVQNEIVLPETGKTPLPIVESATKSDYGISEISSRTERYKAQSSSVDWGGLKALLVSSKNQAKESSYYGVFSVRDDSSGSELYDYHFIELEFSAEAVAESGGETELFIFTTDADEQGVTRVATAIIPAGVQAKNEILNWVLPKRYQRDALSFGEAYKKGCDWEETAPGGWVIFPDGSRTYTPPTVEWVCENEYGDDPEEYEWPTGGGGGCVDPNGCNGGSSNDDPCSGVSGSEICDPDKPCPGDPIKNPTIAPSSGQGVNGGRYGYTRLDDNLDPKFHAGLDIYSPLYSNLYAIHSGDVYSTGVSSTFGNYVIIKSTVDGQVFYMLYAHLSQVGVSDTINSTITQGQIIGRTGASGNASESNPHVHIEVRTAVPGEFYNGWDSHNPESYLGTKFDSNGNPIYSSHCSY